MIAESMKEAAEAAKKLKLGVLELIPGMYALAKGEGVVKATTQTIKWGLFAAAVPIISGVAYAMLSITGAIKKIVTESGALSAAFGKLAEIKALEKMFAPLLRGIDAAHTRIAELIQFVKTAPFDLKSAAEASRSLQLLTSGALATQASLKEVGDVAAATGNPIQDVAGEVGLLFSQLKKGEDITATSEALKNMGVISEETTRRIQDLQNSGAGFSAIWAQVDADLKKSAGGMQKVQDEVGALQGRLEKARENMAAAFGKPFIDAEKTGIKNTIKVSENLIPVLQKIAEALAPVTNTVNNVKSGFMAWITSIPRLGEALGEMTRFAVNAGIALAAIGTGVFINRLRNIGGVVSSVGDVLGTMRGKTGLRDIGDQALVSAKNSKALQQDMLNLAAAQTIIGNKEEAMASRRAAAAAGRSAIGSTAKAALTGDTGAMKSLAASGIAALGRTLLSPWFLIPAAVITAKSAFDSIRATHVANKTAIDALNKSNRETLDGLDRQIASIVTLDDKYRALSATTDAMVAAQDKLASIKLPGPDHQLSVWQKVLNVIISIDRMGAIKTRVGELEKEEPTAKKQKEIAKAQIEAVQNRQQTIAALPEGISEKEIERTKRRAIFEREIHRQQVSAELAVAPNAATREAIHLREANLETERARKGKAEAPLFEKTEREKELKGNTLRETEGKAANATEALDKLTGDAAARNASEEKEIDKIAHNKNITYQEARIKADENRLERLKTTKTLASEFEKSGGTSNETSVNLSVINSARGISDEEVHNLEKRIKNEKDILTVKEEQADISRKSESDLQAITQARIDLSKPTGSLGAKSEVSVRGETFTRREEDIKKLATMESEATDNMVNQQEHERLALEEKVSARQEELRKRTETIDINAEKQILSIKDEGLDREDKLSAITKERLAAEIEAAKTAQAEFEKANPEAPKVKPEDIPDVVAKSREEQERKRTDINRLTQRQDIELQRRSLEIEATTGHGPDEQIHALERQLVLNLDITNAIRSRTNLSKQDKELQLESQAATRNQLKKQLEDAKLARTEQLSGAKSDTLQQSLYMEGDLADEIKDRLSLEERITEALHDQNYELADQLAKQAKISEERHAKQRDMTRQDLNDQSKINRARSQGDETTAIRTEENLERRHQYNQLLQQGFSPEESRQQANRAADEKYRPNMIGHDYDREIPGTDTAADSARQQKAKQEEAAQIQAQRAQRAQDEENRRQSAVLKSAEEKVVRNEHLKAGQQPEKLTAEEEKALSMSAVPIAAGLDKSQVLRNIEENTRNLKDLKPGEPGQPGKPGQTSQPGEPGQSSESSQSQSTSEKSSTFQGQSSEITTLGGEGIRPETLDQLGIKPGQPNIDWPKVKEIQDNADRQSATGQQPGQPGQMPTAQETWKNREQQREENYNSQPQTIAPTEGQTPAEMQQSTPHGYNLVPAGNDQYTYQKQPFQPSLPPAEYEKSNIDINVPGGSMQKAIEQVSPGPGWDYNASTGEWLPPGTQGTGSVAPQIPQTPGQPESSTLTDEEKQHEGLTWSTDKNSDLENAAWLHQQSLKQPQAIGPSEPPQGSGRMDQAYDKFGNPIDATEAARRVAESDRRENQSTDNIPEWQRAGNADATNPPTREDKMPYDECGRPAEPEAPAAPAEPAQAAGASDTSNNTEMINILTEINQNINNLAQKVGVA